MASHQHYRSPFGDTTYTKLFVGGLAWETPAEVMQGYFEQFGEILEAVIITDKNTGKSKGYGFVTFRDPESARRACADPNPVIDSRRANCNIASLGRPRPSPPRGRNQGGNPYQGGGIGQGASSSISYSGGVPPAQLAPPAPPPVVPPVIYPPYGYATYPADYGYPQAFYNPQLQQPQYYQQPYGSSSAMGSPYFYGYSAQPTRGTFPAPQAQRIQGPSYLYYPTQMEGSFPTFPSPPPLRLPSQYTQQTRLSLPSPTGKPLSSMRVR
ncbi:uncharacterized protein LOC131328894 isoform X2 [Rhododendron vialii]|uniref:uncharacterized protein LOC131328894 isoform X2 n=1 Tax=Rhododendron vialii TaxID=182163 RepID=UPI00265FA12C|nr:uncharacterized protein LOC131328894 isoform X2 [Rhododendron vialii]